MVPLFTPIGEYDGAPDFSSMYLSSLLSPYFKAILVFMDERHEDQIQHSLV